MMILENFAEQECGVPHLFQKQGDNFDSDGGRKDINHLLRQESSSSPISPAHSARDTAIAVGTKVDSSTMSISTLHHHSGTGALLPTIRKPMNTGSTGKCSPLHNQKIEEMQERNEIESIPTESDMNYSVELGTLQISPNRGEGALSPNTSPPLSPATEEEAHKLGFIQAQHGSWKFRKEEKIHLCSGSSWENISCNSLLPVSESSSPSALTRSSNSSSASMIESESVSWACNRIDLSFQSSLTECTNNVLTAQGSLSPSSSPSHSTFFRTCLLEQTESKENLNPRIPWAENRKHEEEDERGSGDIMIEAHGCALSTGLIKRKFLHPFLYQEPQSNDLHITTSLLRSQTECRRQMWRRGKVADERRTYDYEEQMFSPCVGRRRSISSLPFTSTFGGGGKRKLHHSYALSIVPASSKSIFVVAMASWLVLTCALHYTVVVWNDPTFVDSNRIPGEDFVIRGGLRQLFDAEMRYTTTESAYLNKSAFDKKLRHQAWRTEFDSGSNGHYKMYVTSNLKSFPPRIVALEDSDTAEYEESFASIKKVTKNGPSHKTLQKFQHTILSHRVSIPYVRNVGVRHFEMQSSDGEHLDKSVFRDVQRRNQHNLHKKEECSPLGEWQTTFYPTCNGMHELDLWDATSAAAGIDRGQEPTRSERLKTKTKGHWRDVWRVERTIPVADVSETEREDVVLKTPKYKHDFSDTFYDKSQVDAIAMEKLTSSPHIINMYGFCGQSSLTEFGAGPQFGEVADKAKGIEKLRLARSIAEGVAHIHAMGVGDHSVVNGPNLLPSFAHFDINPSNIIAVNKTHVKINDFNSGILIRRNVTSNSQCGFESMEADPKMRSPEEALNYTNLTQKVDIYSMGNLLYRIIAQHDPWGKVSRDKRLRKGIIVDRLSRGILPILPSRVKYSQDPATIVIRKVMMECFTFDPQNRPTAKSIVKKLARGMKAADRKYTKLAAATPRVKPRSKKKLFGI